MRDSRRLTSLRTRSPRPGGGRMRRAHQRGVPAGRHLPLPLRAGVLRPRVRLFRPGAPLAAGCAPWRFCKRPPRPGGTITVIEGDHGSTYFHPDSPAAHAAIQCQVEMQRLAGGNASDRPPGLPAAGRGGPRRGPRSPRAWCTWMRAPRSRRRLHAEDVHRDDRGRARGRVGRAHRSGTAFDAGVRELYRTAEADGVFCYTFFKGVGEKGRGV